MKKLILFFTLFLFGLSNSQSFSLVELQNLSLKNWDDFDTDVTKKGYSYFSSEKDEFSEFREYSYSRNLMTGNAKFWITKYKYSDNSEMVSWQTVNKIDYLKIKEQLKTLGYVFIDSQIHKGSNVNNYKKGKKKLSIISSVGTSDAGYKVTAYEISVISE